MITMLMRNQDGFDFSLFNPFFLDTHLQLAGTQANINQQCFPVVPDVVAISVAS